MFKGLFAAGALIGTAGCSASGVRHQYQGFEIRSGARIYSPEKSRARSVHGRTRSRSACATVRGRGRQERYAAGATLPEEFKDFSPEIVKEFAPSRRSSTSASSNPAPRQGQPGRLLHKRRSPRPRRPRPGRPRALPNHRAEGLTTAWIRRSSAARSSASSASSTPSSPSRSRRRPRPLGSSARTASRTAGRRRRRPYFDGTRPSSTTPSRFSRRPTTHRRGARRRPLEIFAEPAELGRFDLTGTTTGPRSSHVRRAGQDCGDVDTEVDKFNTVTRARLPRPRDCPAATAASTRRGAPRRGRGGLAGGYPPDGLEPRAREGDPEQPGRRRPHEPAHIRYPCMRRSATASSSSAAATPRPRSWKEAATPRQQRVRWKAGTCLSPSAAT